MDANIKLGNKLRYYRKQRDFTLKEMAEKIGMSFGTYQKYETGQIKHIDIDIVRKFSKVLDVPTSVLLGWEEEKMITEKEITFAESELHALEKNSDKLINEKRMELEKLYKKHKAIESQIDDEKHRKYVEEQKEAEIREFFDSLMNTYDEETKSNIAAARDIISKATDTDTSSAVSMYRKYLASPPHIRAAVESLLKGTD